jgi:hypothetical protein
MISTDLRAVTATPRATGPDGAAAEPSHIHIPRPSRVGRSAVARRDVAAPVPARPEPALEEAA